MTPVPGYQKYAVDEIGQVWRIGAPRGVPLRPGLRNGYPFVVLSEGSVKQSWSVHILMLLAFKGPCPPGTEGRHLNGVKTDNRLVNLEWSTHKDNCTDRFLHKTQPLGEHCYNAKLTEAAVREIRALPHYAKTAHLQEKFGITKATLSAIRTKRNWKHIT